MNPYTPLPNVPLLRGRESIVLDKCKDKQVLHVGCVDTGLLHDRFAQGQLMHQKLQKVSNILWGMDINAEGIQFLQEKGFQNLFVADATELHTIESWRDVIFDVIVTSEVVEHLSNPGLFFESVKHIMKPGHTELIVTVPNAFRIDTLLWLLKGIEFNHPDHNYWFSYLTISNLVRKNGLAIREMYVYSFQSRLSGWKNIKEYANPELLAPSASSERQIISRQSRLQGSLFRLVLGYFRTIPKRLLVSYLYRKTPFWGDGLIVVCGLDANA